MNEMNVPKGSFWQLSRKIQLVIAIVSAVSAILMTVFALIQISAVEEKNIEKNFNALLQQRVTTVNDYFQEMRSDVKIVASSPMVQKALIAFSRSWTMMGGDSAEKLKRLYVEESPFPKGEKYQLDRSEQDGSAYGQIHEAYHPWFREFVLEKGYEDLILVNATGDVVYSVYKEADYAANLMLGKLKETGLAKIYNDAFKLRNGEQAFYDIKPYEALDGAPAGFIAQPIIVDGENKGVLILRLPLQRMSKVIGNRIGLGDSGEVVLVGNDQLSRVQSLLVDENTVLKRRISGPFILQAINGAQDVVREDVDGMDKIIGYAPVSFLNTKFAVVLMQDFDELYGQLSGFKTYMIMGLIVVVAIVVLIGIVVGNRLGRPVVRLTGLVGGLVNGTVRSIDMQGRNDEVGEIARCLNVIFGMSVENRRIRAALDNATTCIMVADEDRRVIYMNPAVTNMMRNAERDIQQSIPHFSVDAILGQSIDNYHKNPHVQAEILATLNGIHKTRMIMGSRTFNLTAASVRDPDGVRIGSVVEWVDLTDSVAKEQEEKQVAEANYRIRVALENANTNVMVADADRNIIFANTALQNMMVKVESEIAKSIPGFKAQDIIGGSLDRFHKVPAQQAELLAKLDREHSFHLKLGACSFDCVLNPIIDHNNNSRLGSVIEWRDVTDQLAVQKQVDDVVQAVVKGDFSKRISLEGKEGFMVELAQSINDLEDTVSEVINDIAESLSALANGNLQHQIKKDFTGTFEVLKQDTNKTSQRLKQIVGDIIIASNEIAGASTEIASGSIDLSQRTETQASSLEETAASMEEMSTTVHQNAKNAQQANNLAGRARDVAEEGGKVVNQAITAMSSIEDSSQKVSDIIGVIDEIAFQTNLLALNAAVEAARAGDAGKGFAVVASEVRILAQRSGEAAKDIKNLIHDSNSQVREGVQLVGETGSSLENIVESIKRVADIVSEIAAASQEQASGVGEINAAITQMDEMTQQNAALVEESSASARSLEEQSEKMIRLMSFFDIGADNQSQPPVASQQPPVQRDTVTKVSPVKTHHMPHNPVDANEDADWEEF